MKHIVLTGGGTAGHVTPNIAMIPALKEQGFTISYIGSYNGIEKKLIEIAGRTEDVGKPIAFRTTDTFLEVYGLKGIEDLPTLKEIKELEK